MAVTNIKKGTPIVLPPYKWDGTAFDWVGKITQWSTRADLPIAWLREQIEGLGALVHYVSPSANKLRGPLRVPNILFGGEADFITTLPADQRAALDAVGIIHANEPTQFNNSVVGWAQQILNGFPGSEIAGEVAIFPDEAQYLGGRVYNRGGQTVIDDGSYYTIDGINNDLSYNAPPGDNAYCMAADPGLIGYAFPEIQVFSRPGIPAFIKEGTRVELDQEVFLRHVARFGKFKRLIWYTFEPTPYVIYGGRMCSDGSPVFVEDPTLIVDQGDDSYRGAAEYAALQQIYGPLAPYVDLRNYEPTQEQITADILHFFEED